MAENFILIKSKDMDIIIRPNEVSRIIKAGGKFEVIMKDGKVFSFKVTERFSGMDHFCNILTQ